MVISTRLPHIQGLRGLAIVPVVLFHFLPDFFPNGYLGIDIYFVISGFLIAKTLAKEHEPSLLVFADFWFQRIRRILPLYYLILLISTFSLYFVGFPNLPSLIDSAVNAILLKTNLFSCLNCGYFEKMSSLSDLFLHTWSICVEMQFYLLCPLIWFANTLIPEDYKKFEIPWLSVNVISILFFCLAGEFHSLYSVFSRIWQFSVGVFVYKNRSKCDPDNNFLPCTIGLLVLLITLFVPFGGPSASHLRVIATICASLPLAYGEGCILLENRVMTFLGQISFVWYLVHWPVIPLQKQLGIMDDFMVLLGISLVSAAILHWLFERVYLKLDNCHVVILTWVLLMACVLATEPLYEVTPRELQRLHEISAKYENFSKEEVLVFNKDLNIFDVPLLSEKQCDKKEFTSFSQDWQGYCELSGDEAMNKTVMIVGNSWAANVLNVFHQECWPFYANVSAYTIDGCEVLSQSTRSCKVKEEYLQHIKRVRPNVLFIVVKTTDLFHVDDGFLPLEDTLFNSSRTRLSEIQAAVSDKIFLLDVFPKLKNEMTDRINEFIKEKEDYDVLEVKDLMDRQIGMKIAKMRMKELVEGCEKCELFDYVPYFTKSDGSLDLFDEKTLVSFFNSAHHLSLPGLERIRPLYQELCRNASGLPEVEEGATFNNVSFDNLNGTSGEFNATMESQL